MSDTEIRMMRYTIEQLSTELRATKQYVSDIESKLERTRKALDVAVDALKELRPAEKKGCYLVPTVYTTQRIIDEALEQITATLENQNGNC